MSASAAAVVVDVVMPQLGESVAAGTIERWLKKAGDAVALDEPLFEVSSDKATMEVPSLAAGVVAELLAPEGTEVAVGAVVARVAPPGTQPAVSSGSPPADGNGSPGKRLSPVVRRMLRENGLDPSALNGGAQGRITKGEVAAFIASSKPAAPETVAPPRTAAKHDAAARGQSRTMPLSRSRLRTIERLSSAQKKAIDVFSVIEVDMEAVAAERVRRGYTFFPFVARATIDALRTHEALNASIDEDNASVVFHDAVHLGFAVDLDEGGLAVPVVRHAERLTLDALAAEFSRLAQGARSAKLLPGDYGGSTFTISNNGAFGTLMTAPAINPPNVAIISTDVVELRPVVIDRMIAIRHRMYLCMTWDHRVFDGSTAAHFLNRIKRNLETWDWRGL